MNIAKADAKRQDALGDRKNTLLRKFPLLIFFPCKCRSSKPLFFFRKDPNEEEVGSRVTKHLRKPQIHEWEEGGRNEGIMKLASLGANRGREMHILVAKFCRNLG